MLMQNNLNVWGEVTSSKVHADQKLHTFFDTAFPSATAVKKYNYPIVFCDYCRCYHETKCEITIQEECTKVWVAMEWIKWLVLDHWPEFIHSNGGMQANSGRKQI